jgi:hypothetical protein
MSPALSAVALIAAYNEADVIEPVVRDLIANGLSVYFIDDGSTDATVRLVEPFVGHGVLAIERVNGGPEQDASRQFAWERLLRRKAQLASELDADWFLHHDADEFRESPWTGVPLIDGIRRVDALGYNAIDFANLDFWPTHEDFTPGSDPREAFPWYSEAATYDRVQVRCWRKTSKVDLASSGGHDARFENRNVFPIRFISRHYPIRGQAHGERKIFAERRPRFSPSERARNWHVQYDGVQAGASFIRDTRDLTRFDGDVVRTSLTLRHRGVEALEASLAESQSALDAAKCETATARRDMQAAREESERLSDDLQSQRQDGVQLRAALDSRAMELGEARAQLAHVHEALHARNLELADVHTQLGHVHAELARTTQISDEHSRNNATLRDDLARREDAIIAARTETAARERELVSQALELARVRAGLQDITGRLDAVHRSWSWRLTTPVRAVLRWMRGY